MSRNVKKWQIQTRSKTLKTLRSKKQPRTKSKFTNNTGDDGKNLLAKVDQEIISNNQSTAEDIPPLLVPPKPAIKTRNGVWKLAGIARSLHKREEAATKPEVSEAKFSQAVTTWLDLLKSNHFMNLGWSGAVMDGGQNASDADHLKVYLEAYRGKVGFKIWTYSRLRAFTNHLRAALSGERIVNRESTPPTYNISDKPTNFSNTPETKLEMLDRPGDSQQPSPPDSAFYSSVLQVYLFFMLPRSSTTRNNDILEKQNVLSRARQRVDQARAAFEKGSMLPDLEQYVRTLWSGKGAQWSVEAATHVSERLFNFRRDARDLILESLVEPLIEEKRAEDDLVACLEDQRELAVEAGVEAKLKELLELQRWASLEQDE
ncbi:hypothetical protein DL95DRAFT_416672 [Leptodontidium sp. 2 PMI_412]|nr:hypothetical protein DL95DRAFT_416672 [Leptodontidium sp. 2 PMI_412]